MEALAKARTGRSLKFGSAAALQEAVGTYFKACDEISKPYTVTGLALFAENQPVDASQLEIRESPQYLGRHGSFRSPLLFDRPAEGKGLRSALE